MKQILYYSIIFLGCLGIVGAQSFQPSQYNMNWERIKGFGNSVGDTTLGSVDTDNNDGSVVIVGFYSGAINTGGVVLPSNNNRFIVKYGSGGDVLWSRGYGSVNDNMIINDMDIDSGSNIYIAGYFIGSGTGITGLTLGNIRLTGGVSRNFFVAKFSSTGEVLRADKFGFGATTFDGAYVVKVNRENDVFVAGVIRAGDHVFAGVTFPNLDPYPGVGGNNGGSNGSHRFPIILKYSSTGQRLRAAGVTTFNNCATTVGGQLAPDIYRPDFGFDTNNNPYLSFTMRNSCNPYVFSKNSSGNIILLSPTYINPYNTGSDHFLIKFNNTNGFFLRGLRVGTSTGTETMSAWGVDNFGIYRGILNLSTVPQYYSIFYTGFGTGVAITGNLSLGINSTGSYMVSYDSNGSLLAYNKLNQLFPSNTALVNIGALKFDTFGKMYTSIMYSTGVDLGSGVAGSVNTGGKNIGILAFDENNTPKFILGSDVKRTSVGRFTSFDLDKEGNIYLSLSYTGTISFGDKILNSYSNNNFRSVFITKLSKESCFGLSSFGFSNQVIGGFDTTAMCWKKNGYNTLKDSANADVNIETITSDQVYTVSIPYKNLNSTGLSMPRINFLGNREVVSVGSKGTGSLDIKIKVFNPEAVKNLLR